MDQMIMRTLGQGWTPGATGIWFIAAIICIYFFREWRETRKLSAGDRQARREGYEHQVQMLLKENRDLGQDLRDLRTEYDNYRRLCQEETDQLRTEIRRMEGLIRGMERQIQAQAQTLPRVIKDEIRRGSTHDQKVMSNGSPKPN